MIRWLVLFGHVSFFCGPALGAMTITSSSPIDPQIRWGSNVTYTLNGDPPNGGVITKIVWNYWLTSPCTSPPSPAFDTGVDRTIMFFEGTPGTFTVQAKVSWREGYTQKGPMPVLLSVTILPPDDIKLPLAPNNTATLSVTDAPHGFSFPIVCKGEVVGYATGVPREDITEHSMFDVDQPDRLKVGQAPLLTLSLNAILDAKGVGGWGDRWDDFQNLAVGDPFQKYKQRLYIAIHNNYCDTTIFYPLKTTFSVKLTKAGERSYTITISQ